MDLLTEFADLESPFAGDAEWLGEAHGECDCGSGAHHEHEHDSHQRYAHEYYGHEHYEHGECAQCASAAEIADESEMSELFQAENGWLDEHDEDEFWTDDEYDVQGPGSVMADTESFELDMLHESPSDPVSLAIRAAIFLGTRSSSKLTNLGFFLRHPERNWRKLDPSEPNFKALSAEWRSIRDKIVRPLLRSTGGGSSGSGKRGEKTGPIAEVSARLPNTGHGYINTGSSRKYARAEVVEALEWIGAQWAATGNPLVFRVGDISKQGGGKISGHASHRIGLDADVQLLDGTERVNMRKPGYKEHHQASVQQLVDIIVSNPKLPVKAIGFLDTGVKHRVMRRWKNHYKHLHIRFCTPDRRWANKSLERVRIKSDDSKPNYRCSSKKSKAEFDDGGDFEVGFAFDLDEVGYGEIGFDDDYEFEEEYEFEADAHGFDDYEFDDEYSSELELHDEDEFHGEYEEWDEQDEAWSGAESESENESSLVELALKLAIRFGNRNEVSLTNMAFAARHPSRGGSPLDPDEPNFRALSAEWIEIRNRVVRPLLAAGAARGADDGSPSMGGKHYGRLWRNQRPPGLPAWVRGTGKRRGALGDVSRVAAGQGLGRHFELLCEQMAITESQATYGLPARNFNAKPKPERAGARLITAWGVFQYNRDAWTARIPRSDRPSRRSFVPKGVPGCSSRPGCVFPWDVSKVDEIGIPIRHYAATYREILKAGGNSRDAAGGVRLRHKSPTAYRNFRDRGRNDGFLSAWSAMRGRTRRSVESFLGEVEARR